MDNYKMIIDSKKVYSQVYSILILMGEDYINKIPKKLMVLIDHKREKSYMPNYDFSTSFKEQNVNKMALSIICMIDLKYWCSEEEKELLMKSLKQNQLLNEQENMMSNDDENKEIKENYSETQNDFELENYLEAESNTKFESNRKLESDLDIECTSELENNGLIIISKNNFFNKIKNFLLNLFKIKK